MCEYRYQILIDIQHCRCGVHSEAETFEYNLVGAGQMVTYPLCVWTIQHCDVCIAMHSTEQCVNKDIRFQLVFNTAGVVCAVKQRC